MYHRQCPSAETAVLKEHNDTKHNINQSEIPCFSSLDLCVGVDTVELGIFINMVKHSAGLRACLRACV